MIQKKQYETRRPKEKEMIFGVRAVMEAIDAGKVLDKVLVRRDMSSAIGKELLIKLEGTGTQIQRVPLEKLNQFTDKNHQGVIAFLSPIEFTPLDSLVQSLYDEGKTPLLMMLDVYAERNVQAAYFIPIAFYKSLDHLLTKGLATENQNSQAFATITVRPTDHLRLYGSFFIDEKS